MIEKFKIFEQNFFKPKMKRPIDYKCLDIQEVIEKYADEHKIDDEFGYRPIWKWISKNIDKNVEVLLPRPQIWEEEYENQKKMFAGMEDQGVKAMKNPYLDYQSVFTLPIKYDSSEDKENAKKSKQEFMDNMKKMTLARGKKWDEKTYLDNVKFEPESYEYINQFLSVVHKHFGEHYKNGVIKCWKKGDKDTKGIFDYPPLDYENEAYHLSELEKWIESFDMDVTGWYEWILRYNYVEGRYWQRIWGYDLIDKNFRKEEAPENIKQINELLRQLYKIGDTDNPEGEQFPIFVDYYKKIDDEKIY